MLNAPEMAAVLAARRRPIMNRLTKQYLRIIERKFRKTLVNGVTVRIRRAHEWRFGHEVAFDALIDAATQLTALGYSYNYFDRTLTVYIPQE